MPLHHTDDPRERADDIVTGEELRLYQQTGDPSSKSSFSYGDTLATLSGGVPSSWDPSEDSE